MDERDLQSLVTDVRAGRLTRRDFTGMMVGLGLTAPLAAQTLSAAGVAAQPKADGFTPTRRGGGGQIKVLWWQAPTLLNPHFAVGTKDQDGSRVFYEPLAAFDPEGMLFPILAQEIPSLENGGVARDGKSVTWKLKRGVSWHDGKPFTADDLVFNWEYAADPATAAVTITTYRDIERIEKLDAYTVKLVFKNPTPFWFDAFCGARGMIIPKHLFDAYRGAKSREAPTNLKPVGTGPYRFVDFKPGDLVRGEIDSAYHVPNRPYFDQFEMKGGGINSATIQFDDIENVGYAYFFLPGAFSTPGIHTTAQFDAVHGFLGANIGILFVIAAPAPRSLMLLISGVVILVGHRAPATKREVGHWLSAYLSISPTPWTRAG